MKHSDIATMKTLALDFGAVRIGVAIGDDAIGVAHARTFLPHDAATIEAINRLVINEKIGHVLVGHPIGLDGNSTSQTKAAEAFAMQLQQHIYAPVELVDERYSSREAHANLTAGKRRAHEHKKYVDSEAARIFLQAYFDKDDV